MKRNLIILSAIALLFGSCGEVVYAAEMGNIAVHPASCYPAATSGATKEGPTEESGATAPTVRLDFPDGSTTTAYCVFPFPSNAPYKGGCSGSGTPWPCCTGSATGCDSNWQFALTRYSSTDVGNVVWDIEMCVMEGDNTAGPGVFTCSAHSNFTDTGIETNVGLNVSGRAVFGPPSTISDPRFHQGLIRIQRIGGDVSDDETGTATYDMGALIFHDTAQ